MVQLDCLNTVFFWAGLCSFTAVRTAEHGDGPYMSKPTEIRWHG